MVTYPQEWKTCNIGQCVNIYQGGTPKTSNATYWGGDIVWVTPSEITKLSGLYISKSERTITQEGLNNSSATLLPKGTILLCTRATIGDLAIAAIPLTTNQGFKNLTCHKGIYNLFFAYMLSTYKDEMVSKAIGTTFLEISKKELEKIVVHIPPYEEQKAIANCLSSFDTYIDDLTELIEKKRGIRDGALEDLISGRARVTGYNNEWKAQKLCDLAYILNGDRGVNYPNENQFIPFGIPFVNAGNLENGRVDWDNMNYITEDRYNLLGGGKIKKGDILFCLRGSLGKYALVNFSGGAPASSLCIIRAKENTVPSFLLYIIASSLMRNNIEMTNTGSSQPNLSAKDISHYIFKVPADIDEQNEIANILIAMDEEIEALEAERKKMIQIREGVMDDLLTGRVRLKI